MNWLEDENYHVASESRGRLAAHDSKAHFLDTLAALIGCKEGIGGALPDGRRPDVLRINRRRRILFLGDAKHTESPTDKATQARLLGYLRWLSAHVNTQQGLGIFAICFGREADTYRWIETIYMLGCEADINFTWHGVRQFEPGLITVWFVSHTSLLCVEENSHH